MDEGHHDKIAFFCNCFSCRYTASGHTFILTLKQFGSFQAAYSRVYIYIDDCLSNLVKNQVEKVYKELCFAFLNFVSKVN